MDDRRSLMPAQGPIGVSVPGAAGYSQSGSGYSQNPATSGRGPVPNPTQAMPAAGGMPNPTQAMPQPTQAMPAAGATGHQMPPYQPPTQDQVGYPPQPMPNRAYDADGYQAQGQPYGGPVNPQQHTQAIPRVPAQPYGDMRSGEPDLLLATGPDRRQSNRTLLIAAGVFVVLIVVAAVAFSGGGGKPKNGATSNTTATDAPSASAPASVPPGVDPAAKAQADAVYQIIAQSNDLRSRANGALSAVGQCKDVAGNKATFADIAAKRQAQAAAVKALPVDKLPGGAKLVADLAEGWQLSAESENDYAAWANDNLACTGKPSSSGNRAKGDSAGKGAGTAKGKAVEDWNAFATKLGQQTIKVVDL